MATREEKILYQTMTRVLGGTTTPARCQKVVRVFIEELAAMLYRHGEIRIDGFGTFYMSDAPNTGGMIEFFNVATQEMETRYVEKSYMVRFRAGDRFKTIAAGEPIGDYKKARVKKPKTVKKKPSKEEVEFNRMKFLEEQRR